MEEFPVSKKYVKEDKFLNALADAYRLQEAIISTTELAIISTTAQGIITSFNVAAERMLGYTAEEMIGKASPLLFHDPDEIEAHAKELQEEFKTTIGTDFDVFVYKAKTTKTAARREWNYIRKDKTRLPVLLSVTSLWDEHGNLNGYAGIATDITEQKANHAKIKQSESHLHALVTSLDDLVLEVDEHGTYLNIWSKNSAVLFSLKENYIGNTIHTMLGAELSRQYEAVIKRVIQTGQTELLEYRAILPEGEQWRNAKFSFIPANRVLICVRDITHKKQAELELIKSEEKFRTLAENIPGIIYLCNNDASYSMLYLNSKVKDITGYTEDDFTSGKISFVNLYHPDDAADIFDRVDVALQTKQSFHLSYRLRHKSGDWRWVEEMGIGVYHDDNLLLIEGFINDVTVQKQAAEELQKVAEENYRLFNNSISLSVIANFDGNFKRLNPTWTNLLGWEEEEMLSKKMIDFIHPDDIESTQKAILYISAGNHLHTFENRYRCKDGTYRWLLWSSASDLKRELIYASAIDITERKRNEEDLLRSKQNLEIAAENLQEQNRLLDEFAHIISHNLRSPVGNIQALIGLVNQYSSVEDYQLVFDKLKNVSKNLGDTMNELMDTLKVKTSTDIEKIDIRFKETLDKVIQSLEGEMIQFGATVTYDFNTAPRIFFSKAYLESIFQNLLTNAIKYRSLDRKPEIHIESRQYKGKVQLLVKDNGLGIDMERFGDKLFGLHKTFHEHQEAKGVGLFLTKTQIEAMGGRITAESEVNKGSTFIITF